VSGLQPIPPGGVGGVLALRKRAVLRPALELPIRSTLSRPDAPARPSPTQPFKGKKAPNRDSRSRRSPSHFACDRGNPSRPRSRGSRRGPIPVRSIERQVAKRNALCPSTMPRTRPPKAVFTSRKPEAKRFRKWVTSEVLPAIRRTGRYSGYSKDDPDPVLVWAKLLGVRTSDIITKGFGVAYLLGGPIHPSDYLVYNHRVLCHAVKAIASAWPGLHESDYDPRWSKCEWSEKEFASTSRSPTGSPNSSSRPSALNSDPVHPTHAIAADERKIAGGCPFPGRAVSPTLRPDFGRPAATTAPQRPHPAKRRTTQKERRMSFSTGAPTPIE